MKMKAWDKLSAEIATLRGMIVDIRKASVNGPVSVQIVRDELIIEPLVCGAGGVGGSSGSGGGMNICFTGVAVAGAGGNPGLLPKDIGTATCGPSGHANSFPPFQFRPLPVSQAYDSAVLTRLSENPFNGCDLDRLVESIRAVGTPSPAAHRESVCQSLAKLRRKGLVVERDIRNVIQKMGHGLPILRWFPANPPPAVPNSLASLK